MPEPARVEAERLIKELQETDGIGRGTVATHLEQLGQVAVEPLISVLSDSAWPVRFWAACALGTINAREAIPALTVQACLEKDATVKLRMVATLRSLGAIAIPSNPADMHQQIGHLRAQLNKAYARRDVHPARKIREQLIETQLVLCCILKGRALSQEEVLVLRQYYTHSSDETVLTRTDKPKWCWVCWADIDAFQNRRCGCTWRICHCGACQCPDFSIGPKRDPNRPQPECQHQIARLGQDQYNDLVSKRQKRWVDMSWPDPDEVPW